MNDRQIQIRLSQFCIDAAKHQHLDKLFREAWRYQHKRDELRQPKNTALDLTERAATHLLEAIIEIDEPTYLSRLARALIEKWETYRRNYAVYIAEKHGENLRHLNSSRLDFESSMKKTGEILKKMQTT